MTFPTITVYTKKPCVQCDATLRYLKQKGLEFQTDDATAPGNFAALQALGYKQAPVVFVSTPGPGEDEHWSGFRPDLIDLIVERNA